MTLSAQQKMETDVFHKETASLDAAHEHEAAHLGALLEEEERHLSMKCTEANEDSMYNVDAGNLGIRTGFIWAGFSVLLVIAAWFLVPDTTNLTTEEIDKLYTHKTKPRDFQKALDAGEIETEVRRDSILATEGF